MVEIVELFLLLLQTIYFLAVCLSDSANKAWKKIPAAKSVDSLDEETAYEAWQELFWTIKLAV